jgi:hypothetical protein
VTLKGDIEVDVKEIGRENFDCILTDQARIDWSFLIP